MLRAIFKLFLMLNLLVVLINISLPQWHGNGRRAKPENTKYKFQFAPKLLSICINQKCSMVLGSLHFLYSLNVNGGLEVGHPAVGDLGDLLTK